VSHFPELSILQYLIDSRPQRRDGSVKGDGYGVWCEGKRRHGSARANVSGWMRTLAWRTVQVARWSRVFWNRGERRKRLVGKMELNEWASLLLSLRLIYLLLLDPKLLIFIKSDLHKLMLNPEINMKSKFMILSLSII
jgi:hypothetical protein